MNLRLYAQSVSVGSSLLASSARIYLAIGPASACHCRRRLLQQLRRRQIDRATYRTRLEALEYLLAHQAAGTQTHKVDVSDIRQWLPIGDGVHLRRSHKGGGR